MGVCHARVVECHLFFFIIRLACRRDIYFQARKGRRFILLRPFAKGARYQGFNLVPNTCSGL